MTRDVTLRPKASDPKTMAKTNSNTNVALYSKYYGMEHSHTTGIYIGQQKYTERVS